MTALCVLCGAPVPLARDTGKPLATMDGEPVCAPGCPPSRPRRGEPGFYEGTQDQTPPANVPDGDLVIVTTSTVSVPLPIWSLYVELRAAQEAVLVADDRYQSFCEPEHLTAEERAAKDAKMELRIVEHERATERVNAAVCALAAIDLGTTKDALFDSLVPTRPGQDNPPPPRFSGLLAQARAERARLDVSEREAWSRADSCRGHCEEAKIESERLRAPFDALLTPAVADLVAQNYGCLLSWRTGDPCLATLAPGSEEAEWAKLCAHCMIKALMIEVRCAAAREAALRAERVSHGR